MNSGICTGVRQPESRILVSDFDGTMTRRGFLEVVQETFPSDGPDLWAEYMAGKKTHFEAVAGIFARVRGDANQVENLLDKMEMDAELPLAIRLLENKGWRVIIASAGCHWYIQRLLSRAGLSLQVYANPGHYDPQKGLIMTMPPPGKFTVQETGVNKLAIVQAAIDSGADVAYAGDGRPDVASILMVPPVRRFARHWLSRHLAQSSQGFQPFDSWRDIARQLAEDETAATSSPHLGANP